MNRKRIVVLGATGSIGESAQKVARDIPERMEIVGLAAHRSGAKLAQQANELRAEAVCIVDETKLVELRAGLNYSPRILVGESGLSEIANHRRKPEQQPEDGRVRPIQRRQMRRH